jgi:hypothetical protein
MVRHSAENELEIEVLSRLCEIHNDNIKTRSAASDDVNLQLGW